MLKIGPEWFEKVLELQDYAVEIKYPDSIIELSNEEIESALAIAGDFRKMIFEKLDLDLPSNDVNCC